MFKKILLGLLGVIILLVVIGFFLPGKFEIIRDISVNAPAEYVFEEVNELENWDRWSYWNTLDTAMTVTYSEARSGMGASYSWNSPQMGPGKLTITESLPHNSIKVDLDFMENGTAKAWYTFTPDGENTKVAMGFTSEFGMNPLMRWIGVTMMRSEMEKAFSYNLNKLKELAEAKPKFQVNITRENVPPVNYIGLSHTMSPQNAEAIGAQMGKMYGELMGVLAKSKVAMAGYPFCLYPSYSQESMDMICALPVAANAKLPAKYKVMQTSGGNVVKSIHAGSYEKLEATHNEINRYIEFKKLEINGAPWEVYVTDPMEEKDTTKWITEIYYPVK